MPLFTPSSGAISTQDEGTPLSSAVTTFNFVGAGVSAAGASDTATITIPGASTTFSSGLFDYRTDAGNVTTTETDLYSSTLVANQFLNNDDKVFSEYGGVFVSSATATRQVKIYFAGTVIFDTGALTLSLSSAWTATVFLIRVSATVVRYEVSFTTQGAALSAYTSAGELTALTLSGTNILKITGQAAGVGAATNDIVAKLGTVYYVPASSQGWSSGVTVAAIGSTPNANALTLTGQQLNVEPASASFGGVITTGVQTIAGAKTFSGAITASNLSGNNTGDSSTPAETETTTGALIGGAGNATPNDSDFVATSLTAGGILQKITWTNVKAFLKTYYDNLYKKLTITSTATSGGTTVLTSSSNFTQRFTGSVSHQVNLPVASTLFVGWTVEMIHNGTTGSVSIYTSSGVTFLHSLSFGNGCRLRCILASGTTTASWSIESILNEPYLDTIYAAESGVAGAFGVGAATNYSDAPQSGQIGRQAFSASTTTGTSTAYLAVTYIAAISYVTNERFRIRFHLTAGTTPTLNRDSKGAKFLKYYDTSGTKVSCGPNTIIAGQMTDVEYDGTDYILLNLAIVGIASIIYPIGAVVTFGVSTNPATLFGFGTWTAIVGRVIVGIDAGQVEFDTLNETGGAKTHTLTTAEIASHNHTQDAHTHTHIAHNHTQDSHTHILDGKSSSTAGTTAVFMRGSATGTAADVTSQGRVATNQAATSTENAQTATNQATGGGGAHNNLQPYIVKYVWERSA